jgi:undecaprenyl-diphosphatase
MFARLKSLLLRLVERITLVEPVVLVVLAIGTVSLWGFIKVADEVFEGETESFDHWVLHQLRDPADPADAIGPPWVEEMARDATALGGVAWLTFTVGVVAVYLWLDGKPRLMGFTLAATIGGTLVSLLLKSLFDRPRPDLVPHLARVYTSSFPSGHSMLSAVVYLTLGSLLAAALPSHKLKLYVLSVAVLLTIFVGLSRIYLGVHYPTDVLAGWLAGLVWALLCWLVARVLQRADSVERPLQHDS